MERLNDVIGLFGSQYQAFQFTKRELSGLVFRTYLRSSNQFKAGLPVGMSQLFKHVYRSRPMPRYIWVTEISTQHYINRPSAPDRRIIGEIIIDSTADWHAHMSSYLAVHLLGRMIFKSGRNDLSFFVDPLERPYSHLVRSD